MTRSWTRRWQVIAAFGLMATVVSCGGKSHPPASSAPTTAAPVPTFPLTGLPSNGAVLRPALSVKVDNVPPALPQSGLNRADIVWEALVEGGQTRLFATYESQDADRVGPIRSARPVDADLLNRLGGGLFAYSGAAPGEIAPVEQHSEATLLSNDAGVSAFHRDPSRAAPSNVYSSTAALYAAGAAAGDKSAPPPPLFKYGDRNEGNTANGVDVVMGDRLSAGWLWNAATGQYERIQNGAPDVLDDGSRITATNVLVMSVRIEGTGIFDTLGEEDPLVVVIGDGPCWLLRDGKVIDGHWSRPTTESPTTYRDNTGGDLVFQPGRTWVELLPNTSAPTFK